MATGRKGREAAIQILYQVEGAGGVSPADADDGVAKFFDNFEHDEEAREDARALVVGVCTKSAELDAIIEKHATRWKIARMAKVDRNVLRIATFEFLHRPDTPTRVVLNEAIELGKKFGSENSQSFINGVLDPVARELRPA